MDSLLQAVSEALRSESQGPSKTKAKNKAKTKAKTKAKAQPKAQPKRLAPPQKHKPVMRYVNRRGQAPPLAEYHARIINYWRTRQRRVFELTEELSRVLSEESGEPAKGFVLTFDTQGRCFLQRTPETQVNGPAYRFTRDQVYYQWTHNGVRATQPFLVYTPGEHLRCYRDFGPRQLLMLSHLDVS